MDFKIVEGWKVEFEESLKDLVGQGYWILGDIKTNIIQDQIYYSALVNKA